MKARIFGFVAALAVSVLSPAKADVIYTYTGKLFDTFGGTAACPSTCEITGSFTVSNALAANLSYNAAVANVTPIAYSFSNGTYNITQSDNPLQAFFSIGTNGSGAITQWVIGIISADSTRSWDSDAPDPNTHVFDQTYLGGIGANYALNHNSPGTWSVSETPLPATWTMMLGGLAGFGLLSAYRRRKNTEALAAA
jgi:hypothetical protein